MHRFARNAQKASCRFAHALTKSANHHNPSRPAAYWESRPAPWRLPPPLPRPARTPRSRQGRAAVCPYVRGRGGACPTLPVTAVRRVSTPQRAAVSAPGQRRRGTERGGKAPSWTLARLYLFLSPSLPSPRLPSSADPRSSPAVPHSGGKGPHRARPEASSLAGGGRAAGRKRRRLPRAPAARRCRPAFPPRDLYPPLSSGTMLVGRGRRAGSQNGGDTRRAGGAGRPGRMGAGNRLHLPLPGAAGGLITPSRRAGTPRSSTGRVTLPLEFLAVAFPRVVARRPQWRRGAGSGRLRAGRASAPRRSAAISLRCRARGERSLHSVRGERRELRAELRRGWREVKAVVLIFRVAETRRWALRRFSIALLLGGSLWKRRGRSVSRPAPGWGVIVHGAALLPCQPCHPVDVCHVQWALWTRGIVQSSGAGRCRYPFSTPPAVNTHDIRGIPPWSWWAAQRSGSAKTVPHTFPTCIQVKTRSSLGRWSAPRPESSVLMSSPAFLSSLPSEHIFLAQEFQSMMNKKVQHSLWALCPLPGKLKPL